ncbi:hypothetical protein TSAR_000370, partial [Trichomalopsis sarcophagae]
VMGLGFMDLLISCKVMSLGFLGLGYMDLGVMSLGFMGLGYMDLGFIGLGNMGLGCSDNSVLLDFAMHLVLSLDDDDGDVNDDTEVGVIEGFAVEMSSFFKFVQALCSGDVSCAEGFSFSLK